MSGCRSILLAGKPDHRIIPAFQYQAPSWALLLTSFFFFLVGFHSFECYAATPDRRLCVEVGSVFIHMNDESSGVFTTEAYWPKSIAFYRHECLWLAVVCSE